MRYILLTIFIIIPVLEITAIMLSGNIIGIGPTLILIFLTALLGGYYARKQGLETFRKAQRQMQYGEMPGDTIMDGVCILVGAILLLLPGFFTDILGLVLLLPPTRALIKGRLFKAITKRVNKRNIKIIT
ncbi:FxsA family protein [Cytobacillus gottheilii]|uniref:Membrane protein FxsA n=1 Tax=Cytobacillus gottheilii TaxID=859144 RepID=A0ABX8F9I1_9BACI|nr:FxsA family protein [Cytobacillus gottheilii]QVY60654.1 membrane protein FxsA [Cytobacillus gottheilii]